MANTVTQTTLVGGASDNMVIRRIHIVSDGSEETDLVVYDNSALIADTSKGNLVALDVYGKFTGAIRLEWDADTDVPIISVGESDAGHHCFKKFGGFPNPGGTGKTGDIVLTTTALANLDEVTLILHIKQK